ncbi:mgtA regulatory leader peptide MgtL [Salmonella enterica subsp. enterica serovar Newport]|uniref:mgtA leader peptide n=2 Tax=Salmonella enterica TaxID=28901 RepID=A0A743QWC6_SALER|nr:mgtA regulatory leader peptide MgtL [Salmonella enterica]EBG5399395.1 mgtA regulatory leader peptide MgtL [Salmonella enterica subsp. enterica serovar Newport]EGQ0554031.1 mgtA regulatory leader peptide MgtL [Salmonella enterica subsp. enterica]EKT7600163.1 mgtA regulatory leader peptide MgtL [Salmonella enterica subsp. enterica serovar Bareilly]QVX94211.1 mgtA regulatory leader peptide MgtL [Salmonella enterica subsp. enterica serovar Derby]
MRIIRGANYLLTGGDMDPEPTPLPRWRIFSLPLLSYRCVRQ